MLGVSTVREPFGRFFDPVFRLTVGIYEKDRLQPRPWSYLPLSESPIHIADLRRRLRANGRDEDALYSLSRRYSERGQVLAEALTRLAPESFRTTQLKATAAEY